MLKAVKIAKNQKGTKFAIVEHRPQQFSVWKLCANYAAHVRGGIAHTWRFCGPNINRGEFFDLPGAEKYFSNRLAGRQ